jgi:hypothetical protein
MQGEIKWFPRRKALQRLTYNHEVCQPDYANLKVSVQAPVALIRPLWRPLRQSMARRPRDRSGNRNCSLGPIPVMLLTSRIFLSRQDIGCDNACAKVAGTLRVPSPSSAVTFTLNAGYGTRSVPTTLVAAMLRHAKA